MNTILSNQVRPVSFDSQRSTELSIETKQLLAIGRQENWLFQVLGKAPMPEKPVRLGEWLVTPAEMDSSVIPARALTRVQAIFAAGIRPQGFVLVHEAPKLLPSPTGVGGTKQEFIILSNSRNPWPAWIGKAAAVLGIAVAAIAGLAVLVVAVFALLAFLAIPLFLFAASSGLDPILVAVTEDGYWIEIDRWITETNP